MISTMEKMLAKQCWLKFVASIKVLWVFCIFKRMSKQFLCLYSMLIPFTKNTEIIRAMRSSATVHPGLIPSCDGSDATSCRKPSHPSREVMCPQHSCFPCCLPKPGSAWRDTEPQPGLWLCLVNEWHNQVNHFTQPWGGFHLCSCL